MSRERTSRRLRRLPLLALAAFVAGGTLFARVPTSGGPGNANGESSTERALARVAAAPGDAGKENDLGNQLLLAGELDAAEAAYRRAIAAAPSDPKPHYNLGSLLLDRGRRFSARSELLRAIELDPTNAAARFALGEAYDELGFDSLARRNYRRAFELEPELGDPKLHPEAARRRLALAVLLELWREEPEPIEPSKTGAAVAPARGSSADSKPTREPEVDQVDRSADSDKGGGYARLTGGERNGQSSQSGESENAFEPSDDAASRTPSERPSRTRGRSAADSVIDPTDLRSGTSVNQVVAPGESSRGGRSSGTRGKPTRPNGSRFVPPPRPFEPPDEPEFEPDEESTGRIEPLLLPADADRFAIAG